VFSGFHIVFSVKVKFSVLLLCVYVCILPEKGRPRNDLYCVGRNVKPYVLNPTHSLTHFRKSTVWLDVLILTELTGFIKHTCSS